MIYYIIYEFPCFSYITLTFTKTGFIVHLLGNSNASFQYSVKRVEVYVQIPVQQSFWVGAFKLFVQQIAAFDRSKNASCNPA